MRLLIRVVILLLSAVLGGCIASDTDLSNTYRQIFPIDSGECVSNPNSHAINVIKRNASNYTFQIKGEKTPISFKILKMPESDNIYVAMLLMGDTHRQYVFISAPNKDGGITVYDFAPRHQWLLPADLKNIVEADNNDTYVVKLKNDEQIARFLRTMLRLKIQDDPEITKFVCKPLDRPFVSPKD